MAVSAQHELGVGDSPMPVSGRKRRWKGGKLLQREASREDNRKIKHGRKRKRWHGGGANRG